MSIKFSKALLMSGKDYQLTDFITLHHPTVDEALSISISNTPDNYYLKYVQIILSDPYDNMVMLDDMGKNYLEVSPYEVFIFQWDNCYRDYIENKEIYDLYHISPLSNILNALSFFIDGNHIFEKGTCDDGTICFYDIANKNCLINKEIFEYIHEWVVAINKIDFSNRINPADENARKILIEDMRDKIKKDKKKRKNKSDDNHDFLGNIMSAVCFCGNGAVTPFNINNCKIYWLNEALQIRNKKSNADHLIDGIYHGTISSKDIEKKELNWIS